MKVKAQENSAIKGSILEFVSLPHWNKMMNYLRDGLKKRSDFDIIRLCFPPTQAENFRPRAKLFLTERYISSDYALSELKLRLNNHSLISCPSSNRRKYALKSDYFDEKNDFSHVPKLLVEPTINSSTFDEIPFEFNAIQCMGR
jgi:hypothetical protein